jgi:glycerophosphoryl diester phosphodiesterase
MEQLAPDMMFMPIYKEEDTLTPLLEQMDVNFVGAELVFAEDTSPIAQPDYIRGHKEKGRLLWCNAILFNCKKPLSGGHTDDVAVTGDPDKGWGWIADRGFDIIQTDWVMPLKAYLQSR